MIDGLYHCLRSTEQPVPKAPRFAPRVAQQTSVGWSQLLFGRWSSEWTEQQLHYLTAQGTTPTPHNHGPNWVRSMVQIIWSHCHDAWLTRNKSLHGHDVDSRRSYTHPALYHDTSTTRKPTHSLCIFPIVRPTTCGGTSHSCDFTSLHPNLVLSFALLGAERVWCIVRPCTGYTSASK